MTQNVAAQRGPYASTWLMAAACILIGVGAALEQLDVATAMVILALIAAGTAVLVPDVGSLRALRRRSVIMVIVAGVAVMALVFTAQSTLPIPVKLLLPVLAAIGLHAVLVGGRWRSVELGVVIVGHFVLMAGMLAVSGPPDIDVYDFQQQASAALLRGENPYGLRYLNTAEPGSVYYAPENIDGDHLAFGFTFPPVSLLLALPGYVIAGDYRYAALASLSVTALLILLLRPGALSAGAALLVLFAPMTQFILYWGWTEPFVTLLLAVTLFLAARAAATTPVGLGLLIASKQYLAPLLILGVLLLRQARRRVGGLAFAAISIGVAMATVIPFLAWDVASFTYSTITVHFLQLFRDDSLSIPALLVRAGFEQLPGWVGFALGGLALLLVAWRAPRTPAGFCAGAAVVLMTFFLFSKQAFLNYYLVPLVALAIAVALIDTDGVSDATAAGGSQA